jgi:toxin ParE1/3/4
VKPVEFHAAAKVELDDAVSFYESRAEGLGLDLMEKIRDAVGKIQRNPEAWPPHRRGGFRKLFAERFPYTIFYLELPGLIWIVAIAHGSRRPDYWSKRRRS